MTTVANDLMHLRSVADDKVRRRWRRRTIAIVLLSLLAIAMAVPTFAHISTLPVYSSAMSYLRFPGVTFPGDIGDAVPPANGDRAVVTAWTVGTGAVESYLLVRIEATTALDPVPAMSIVARWDAEPPGVTTMQIARTEELIPGWEAGSVGSVVGVIDEHALLVPPSQQCSSWATIGVSGSYCLLTAAIVMGEGTPLPDSILITDVASGTLVFEVLLEREAYRANACQVNGCGSLTPVP